MSKNREEKMKKIILGSGSKKRAELLRSWGYEFEVMTSSVDEKNMRLEDPRELTLALAHAKAGTLLFHTEKNSILVTSDTVLYLDGKIIEKPESKKEAREMFLNYANSELKAFTAVVVINISTGKMLDGVDKASFIFSEFSEDVINELVEKEDTYERAGGFDIDDPLLKPFVKEINGEVETIMGLPKMLTQRLIQEVD